MKKRLTTAIIVICILFMTILLSIKSSSQTSGTETWWNPNWSYARGINITEKSGTTLINFPIHITFEHHGKIKAMGEDIRVIIDGSEIPSFVSEINNINATVTFSTALNGSETKTVYIYYGNPQATKPNYELTSLNISEGQKGYAIIDNSIYIGWDFTSWGWSNNVELWNNFRIDFNNNNDLSDDNNLIGSYNNRQGGIGRSRQDVEAFGLGEYQGYNQTPIYVTLKFADATLTVYRNNPWVETTQADCLHMFNPTYDYMSYGNESEIKIVDGQGINIPDGFATGFWSKENPTWMAFRNSASGNILSSSGIRISNEYAYHIGGKEASDWDRAINYNNKTRYELIAPYDQPTECRIYWYGDKSNNYSRIQIMANIFNNQPLIVIENEIQGTTTLTPTPTTSPTSNLTPTLTPTVTDTKSGTPSPTKTISPSPTYLPDNTPQPSVPELSLWVISALLIVSLSIAVAFKKKL